MTPRPAGARPTAPPTDLPVESVVGEVAAALGTRGAAVLVAPPGAGKTTVAPLRLLDAPWLGDERIMVLEPRRLAARAAARRMADLLGERVGDTVGVRTRDDARVGPTTRIEVVTEGILVRRLQGDPALEGVGLVVLDEVHERSIHTDLALALLLDARSALCPDLRLLAMSATVAAEPLAELLGSGPPDGGGTGPGRRADGPAPIVRSDGRQHPVALHWAPALARERPEGHLARVVAQALSTTREGDVLAFVPGAAEVRRSIQALRRPGVLAPTVDVLPLFGGLSGAEQDRALEPSRPGRRRVVVATDIAESSLTVDGVRIVVDAGWSRVPRLDPRTGLSRLVTVAASQASADQRSGRAGRLGPGVAHRLWAQTEHASRPAYAAPEIAGADLAPFALEVAIWGADVDQLAFPDRPPAAALAEARTLLRRLGVLDDHDRATALGRRVAALPLHPRLARMVVEAPREVAWTACLLAAALEERDVLRGPPDQVPADAAERVRVLADDDAGHPALDVGTRRATRRRAQQIARRARIADSRQPPDAATLSALGHLLGLAYPDRLARGRGGGHFRLRNGAGAWLAETDPLASEPWLVVAEVDTGGRSAVAGARPLGRVPRPTGPRGAGRVEADGRIRIAAALDEADVVALGGDEVTETSTLVWDERLDDLRARTERRLDALVLASHEGPAPAGEATTAALLAHVRSRGLGVLRWSDGARRFQARAEAARRAGLTRGEQWPDLSDAGLLADLDLWLAPLLSRATGRRHLEAVDLRSALQGRLGHPWTGRLADVAPERFTLPGGREVPIDWSGDAPALHVRVQDLYGTTVHPSVGGGATPLVLHLQSPAGRDVQVTADLPGFWAGSWSEVRKEMAGRYPRHAWPLDPASASPPPPRARRRPR